MYEKPMVVNNLHTFLEVLTVLYAFWIEKPSVPAVSRNGEKRRTLIISSYFFHSGFYLNVSDEVHISFPFFRIRSGCVVCVVRCSSLMMLTSRCFFLDTVYCK